MIASLPPAARRLRRRAAGGRDDVAWRPLRPSASSAVRVSPIRSVTAHRPLPFSFSSPAPVDGFSGGRESRRTPWQYQHGRSHTDAVVLRWIGPYRVPTAVRTGPVVPFLIGATLCEEQFPSNLPADEMAVDGPVPPLIEQHCKELGESDGIVVIHPNWWGQPPAILKGWVDRVVRPGIAYRFQETDSGEGVPIGLLIARAALVFNTSNTFPQREQAVFGDPLQTIWKNCIFDLCGVKTFFRRTFCVVVTSSHEQRTQWLREVREAVLSYLPPNMLPRAE